MHTLPTVKWKLQWLFYTRLFLLESAYIDFQPQFHWRYGSVKALTFATKGLADGEVSRFIGEFDV